VHFDHTFGNAAMEGATIHAHENAARALAEHAADIRRQIEADPDPDPDPDQPAITAQVLDDVRTTEPRPPDVVFSSVRTIDLGDRLIELMHPGSGHTDGDLVARVADADVLFGGDLLEESGPPSFGTDSFPLDWAGSLDLVVGLLTDRTVVVPGHGAPVDRSFVQTQRAAIADVSNLIRGLHAQGVAAEQAVAAGGDDWPFPTTTIEGAVRRGYAQLSGAS
jgi:glyoxylase-like metal-dependent hydrolase (beta-lactamase superfamily II)